MSEKVIEFLECYGLMIFGILIYVVTLLFCKYN